MKLFIILICLMSERYLTHQFSQHRLKGFEVYRDKLQSLLQGLPEGLTRPYLMLAYGILGPALVLALILKLTHGWGYGFVELLISLAVFYYCLGPENPFYEAKSEKQTNTTLKNYFQKMNTVLFAPILWFLFLGPVAVFIYRLIEFYSHKSDQNKEAQFVLSYLNWLPVRIEAILYLFVGHFQEGFKYLSAHFLLTPEKNDEILGKTALLALKENEESADMTKAEHMVEHALIVLLVFIALLTLVSWI